jgi:D-glycerate 3-kinase
MARDWITDFLEREQLPEAFRATIGAVCEPLADFAVNLRLQQPRAAVIGICGAQGCGKSTITAATVRLLQKRGVDAVMLSLDDFYLTRSAREELAQRIHPLFATRGPPGTHDVARIRAVLERLKLPGSLRLPVFDKSTDDYKPREQWRSVLAPAEIIFLEGWCVGARPQMRSALAEPINRLEAEEDPAGEWRNAINDQLTGQYWDLFAKLHALVLLQAPGFEAVFEWRREQEHKLIARTGQGMTDEELARFVAHYERLTRWMLSEMPQRADLVVKLDADRTPLVLERA